MKPDNPLRFNICTEGLSKYSSSTKLAYIGERASLWHIKQVLFSQDTFWVGVFFQFKRQRAYPGPLNDNEILKMHCTFPNSRL